MVIQTAEGMRFTLPLAGPVSRFLAWAIDAAVISVATGVAAKGLGALKFLGNDLTVGLSVLSFFAIWIGYAILLEWLWSGQTVGKRALGLRVLDATGRRLQFPQIVLRNVMRFLDGLPFFLPRRRRCHAAQTGVINAWEILLQIPLCCGGGDRIYRRSKADCGKRSTTLSWMCRTWRRACGNKPRRS